MTSANNFRALFGLARPKLLFNSNILFKAVAQHGIDGGLIGAILLYLQFRRPYETGVFTVFRLFSSDGKLSLQFSMSHNANSLLLLFPSDLSFAAFHSS